MGPELGDADVGIGVEAVDEFFSLVEHVGLDLVMDAIPGETVVGLVNVFAGASFDGVQVDEVFVAYHTSECEAKSGRMALIVVATAEMGVVFDGENLFKEEEAVEDSCFYARSDRDDELGAIGMIGGEGEAGKTAGGWADDGFEFIDAEVVEEEDLGIDDIAGADVREFGAVGFIGFGIRGGGTGGTVATADVIRADDKEAISVEGFTGADEAVPPAWVAFLCPVLGIAWSGRISAGSVLGPGEGVEEKDGVILGRGQFAVGFVRERERGQGGAIDEVEGSVAKE